MRRFNKIFCIIFSIFLLFGTVACNSNEATTPAETVLQYANDFNDKTKELCLVKDGATEYKIVTPINYSASVGFALNELRNILYESTGLNFQVITDQGITYDESKYYISLGDTSILKGSNIDYSFKKLNYDGCVVKLCGNQIILAGANSGSEYGYINAVYDFLEMAINYQCYATTEIQFDKTNYIPLMTYDSVNVPDIAIRSLSFYKLNSDTVANTYNAARMRTMQARGNGPETLNGPLAISGWAHNLDVFVDPLEYPQYWNSGQLCFSNPEVATLISQRAIEFLESAPNASYVPVSIEDNYASCPCPNCVASDAKYGGSPAGTMLECVNKVAKAVKEHFKDSGRDIKVLTLAYNNYVNAPQNIVAEDNVVVYIAPIFRCYKHALTDCERNVDFYKSMMKWAEITNHLAIYDYGTEFTNYFIYFNDWNRFEKDFKLYKEVGVSMYYTLASIANEVSPLVDLRIYVSSKLLWDTDRDTNELVDEFMSNYYYAGADYMKDFYNLISANNSYHEKNGYKDQYVYNNIAERYYDTTILSLKLCQQLLDLCNKAQDAIKAADYAPEKESQLLERIEYEKFYVKQTLIELHGNIFSQSEMQELLAEQDYYAELFGIVNSDQQTARG